MASGTPSAQVRIPVANLVFLPPPPPTYAHTILLAEKLSGGGVKIMRRQNIYKGAVGVREVGGGRGWAKGRNYFRKNFTVLKIVAQCRKYPIPYLNTLRDHLCSKPNAIAYLIDYRSFILS